MFDNELRKDLLITALEGGSNYWYYIPELENLTTADGIFEALLNQKCFEVYDIEVPETFLGFLNIVDIERGEKVMKELAPKHYKNIKKDNWDAESADVWFQCVIMKDLVFS